MLQFDPLPNGWDSCQTPHGRTYYTDHNSRSTTWDDPRRSLSLGLRPSCEGNGLMDNAAQMRYNDPAGFGMASGNITNMPLLKWQPDSDICGRYPFSPQRPLFSGGPGTPPFFSVENYDGNNSNQPDFVGCIFIQTLSGWTFTFSVTWWVTIGSIKSLIQGCEGIFPDQQRLLFQGIELNDCSTLSDCSIQPGSTLCLVLSIPYY
jgi:large subunit ribosomal protein L40e